MDISLTRPAFVVVDRVGDCLFQGIPKRIGKMRGMARIAYAREYLKLVLQKYPPSMIAIEGYSFGSIGRQAAAGEMCGTLKMVIHDTPLSKPLIIPPTTLKKYVTGHGNSAKSGMLKGVFVRWNFDTEDDDIADAYSLAMTVRDYYNRMHGGPKPSIKYQQEVMKKLDSIYETEV